MNTPLAKLVFTQVVARPHWVVADTKQLSARDIILFRKSSGPLPCLICERVSNRRLRCVAVRCVSMRNYTYCGTASNQTPYVSWSRSMHHVGLPAIITGVVGRDRSRLKRTQRVRPVLPA